MVDHGTRRAYGAGCRCDACTTANREAVREWRAARRAARPEGAPPPVAVERPVEADAVGPQKPATAMADAVEAALRTLSVAVGKRPELPAMARTLAQLIDNPQALPQRVTATAQLRQVLEDLRAAAPASDAPADPLDEIRTRREQRSA